jgi:hypothetical protein
VTLFEPSASLNNHSQGIADFAFMPDKTVRRMPVQVESRSREPITSAELHALQRRFDRFISELNPPRYKSTTAGSTHGVNPTITITGKT